METNTNLELVGVTKRYGSTVAVRDVDHKFKEGSYTCLLGPSGCGKSSTLRMIAGHESVTEGAVVLAGRDVSHLPPAKRGTAMMFQNYALFPHLSVADNIGFGLAKGRRRSEKIEQLARLVGIEELIDRQPGEISGGQAQRVALARALAPNPDAILLDEPFAALDTVLRHQLAREVVELLREADTTCHASDIQLW